MGTQAILDPREHGHLIGDVAALFIAAFVPREHPYRNESEFELREPILIGLLGCVAVPANQYD
jgi:hypothetical protein